MIEDIFDDDHWENREEHFEIETGQFRDPDTGEFEEGGPPPDYSEEANRYRAEDGEFKERSADLYDERAEVVFDDLDFEG